MKLMYTCVNITIQSFYFKFEAFNYVTQASLQNH